VSATDEAEREPVGTPRVDVYDLDKAWDFLDVLHPVTGLFGGGGLVFRGQRDASWGLVPSAFRTDAPLLLQGSQFRRCPRTNGVQVRLEIELLRHFVSIADVEGLLIPGDSERVREYLAMVTRNSWLDLNQA